MTKTASIFLSFMASVVGAQPPGLPKATPKAVSKAPSPGATDDSIRQLRKRIDELETQVKYLSEMVSPMSLDIATLKRASATFDPASPNKYDRVDTGAGQLLVSLGKVEPYLDGYRVEVQIGNPLTLTFRGFTISATWAPRFTSYTNRYLEWYKKNRKKNFDFTDDLTSGMWNRVSLILPETKPEDFGSIEISLNVNSIFMRTALPQ